ncbi:MAG TPA: ABC transporter substrate-binding protein [Caldilineaceae bacterium]|nr:ABC transporter substrate-binding protein [Caldilineaceae bacterium]
MNRQRMNRQRQSYFRLLVALFLVTAVVYGCAQPGDDTAAPGDAVEAATATVPAEPAATPTEDQSQANNEAVQQSKSVQAADTKGITVTSDEDVTTPRTHAGGEYHDVATSDAVSFHPYLTTDTGSSGYQAMVWTGGLLRLDENSLEYIPNMAESYDISEDGLTFTFHLRQNMEWSDGEPLTAEDFAWTYDQVVNPDNGFPYLSQLDFIDSYTALDTYTLQITIKEVYAPALGQMSALITPLPKHIWEGLDWQDPEKNPEINNPTVVSGPYKLLEWKRDQYATFEANENYWYHGAPNISKYTIEIVPDQDIAYQKMKTGESDTGDITPEKLDEARSLPNINVYEWWPAAARWSYIGLNLRDGFATSDVNVRHGLSYAIDKQLLTDEVMLGQAKRLCSVFPETSWVYNPDVPCYEYDVEKATAAFAEAGYTLTDGQMVDADGNQLELKLIYGPNTSKVRELIAVTVQDYLSQIGVKVEIQAMEWSSFLDAIQAEDPDWDMFIGGWAATIEPHIMYTIFAEQSIPSLNAGAYINKEVEQLFEEGGATYDTAVRKEKYGEVQRIIAEDSPYIFLFYQKAWSGQNKRIQGIEPTALGIGWNTEDWYIEATQ